MVEIVRRKRRHKRRRLVLRWDMPKKPAMNDGYPAYTEYLGSTICGLNFNNFRSPVLTSNPLGVRDETMDELYNDRQ